MVSTWATIGILTAGIVVVVGGILLLRLHAFLALILAAFLVAALTPAGSIENDAIRNKAIKVLSAEDVETGQLALPRDRVPEAIGVLLLLRPNRETRCYDEVARWRVDANALTDGDQAVFPFGTTRPSPRCDDVLITLQARVTAAELSEQTVAKRVTDGFGSTCAKIGILIAMASIIGKCLLDSGAADRIVRSLLKWLGERRAGLAFLTSGFALGIPVFFDTVFYLMIPLGKAMRVRTGHNYLLYVLTIVAGATMAHSLVPPTPGPLFVAEELGVDVGEMMLGGCIVGLFTVTAGYWYARVANSLSQLPLRESPDFSIADLEQVAKQEECDLPPTWLSLLPIVLPVLLIGGSAVLKRVTPSTDSELLHIAATLGDKNVALIVSAAIAMAMLVWRKRTSLKELSESTQAALASGAVIVLITAAGGAFGRALQQTGVSDLIRNLPDASPALIVILAFLITAAIRTAQGSGTVAMITAVGVLSGLATDLPFHPVYLALAIGCGSKPLAWMNDSGFWVTTKMSGMTEAEGLKYVTPMTALMAIAGLAVTLFGVLVFPLTPG